VDLSGLGSIACRAQDAAVPDDAHEQADRVPDTCRHHDQTERRAEAKGHDFVRRRYHVEPKNEIKQPLCSADPHQSGPEAMPKSQEDCESKTKRMRVDSIHFYHLFSQFAVLPTTNLIISQTLQHRTVTQITQVRGRGNNKKRHKEMPFSLRNSPIGKSLVPSRCKMPHSDMKTSLDLARGMGLVRWEE
jgi:hypothetical protein